MTSRIKRIDREALRDLILWAMHAGLTVDVSDVWVDRFLAHMQVADGLTLTPDEAETVLGAIRQQIADLERLGDNSRAIARLNSLVQRLDAYCRDCHTRNEHGDG